MKMKLIIDLYTKNGPTSRENSVSTKHSMLRKNQKEKDGKQKISQIKPDPKRENSVSTQDFKIKPDPEKENSVSTKDFTDQTRRKLPFSL